MIHQYCAAVVSTKELYEQTLKARRLHGRSAVAPLLEPYLNATRWPSGAPLPFDITQVAQKRPRGASMMQALLKLLLLSLLLGFNLCAIGCIATNRSYADGLSLSTKTAVCAAMLAVAFPLCIPSFRAQLAKHEVQVRNGVWRQVNMLCILMYLQESDPSQRKALLSKIRMPDPTAPGVLWASADLLFHAQPTQPKTSPVPCLQSLLSFAEVLQQTRRQQGLPGCCLDAKRLDRVIPALQPYLGGRHFKSGKPLPPKLCAELDLPDADPLPRSCRDKDSGRQCLFIQPLCSLAGCIRGGCESMVWLLALVALNAFLFCLPLAAASTKQCPFGTSAQLIPAIAVLACGLLACNCLEAVPFGVHQAHNLSLYRWTPRLDVLYLLYMQDHGVPAAEPADVVHKFKLGDVVYTSYSDGSYTEYPSSPPTRCDFDGLVGAEGAEALLHDF